MLNHLKNETNVAYTTNGAKALKTSNSYLVDFFASSGALRNRSKEDINQLFSKAFAEDKLLAMKALFYTRDIRGGQGERETFKTIIKQLAFTHPEVLASNINLIPYFGRYDDLLVLLDTPLEKLAMSIIRAQLLEDLDLEAPSLLAKWLPSENASSRETKRLAKKVVYNLGLTPKQYRKTLTTLRKKINIVEGLMSAKKFNEVEYDKIPSKAGLIYRNAFYRNDGERYTAFVDSLVKSVENNDKETKINVKTLFPYEIIGKFPITMTTANNRRHYNAVVGHASSQDEKLLDAMWKSLPDFIGDNFDNALAVVDTSGSMRGLPIQVALSLGLYLAERNKGIFNNHFITFSKKPELQEVLGDTLGDKLRNMSQADWDMNTDIQSVFSLILNTAIKNNVPQEELPSKIFIISDMEFDKCVGSGNNKTVFGELANDFAKFGYVIPELVFWNVNALSTHFPVKYNETGTALVSGCSPTVFKNLLAGKEMTPYAMMLDVLNNERYDIVMA
jgi:hypothetical protein